MGRATPLEIAAYYDGRTLTLSEKPDGKWAQTTVPGTLDEMLDDVARRFGLPVPIGDVVYSSPYDAFIGSIHEGRTRGARRRSTACRARSSTTPTNWCR